MPLIDALGWTPARQAQAAARQHTHTAAATRAGEGLGNVPWTLVFSHSSVMPSDSSRLGFLKSGHAREQRCCQHWQRFPSFRQ